MMVSRMVYFVLKTGSSGILLTLLSFFSALHSSWSQRQQFCDNGRSQSPINIPKSFVQQPPQNSSVNFYNYNKHVTANITYNDYSVTLQVNQLDGVKLILNNKTEYALHSIHFHAGCTEHTFDNKSYGLELHLVHYNKGVGDFSFAKTTPGGLAVVAVLFEQSESFENEAMNIILDMIKSNSTNRGLDKKSLQYRQLLPQALTHVYQYSGSLTTPPCYESVTWNVVNQTNYMSARQINKFIRLHRSRTSPCRPIQFLNNRQILCVGTKEASGDASTLRSFNKLFYIVISWFTCYLLTSFSLRN